MVLDSELASLVRDLDDVWPLEVVLLLPLSEDLYSQVSVGNQVCITLVVLEERERERGMMEIKYNCRGSLPGRQRDGNHSDGVS